MVSYDCSGFAKISLAASTSSSIFVEGGRRAPVLNLSSMLHILYNLIQEKKSLEKSEIRRHKEKQANERKQRSSATAIEQRFTRSNLEDAILARTLQGGGNIAIHD